ncbi:hypothetical protein [Actinomadura rubrisoli]|uniref:hypothetical protein n=1 Tax=Actinomadura rubrisoli TaxID=2530368 RepID=UPI001FB66A9E|nr:hypothetical protein [Actinomadura rubrisoli]
MTASSPAVEMDDDPAAGPVVAQGVLHQVADEMPEEGRVAQQQGFDVRLDRDVTVPGVGLVLTEDGLHDSGGVERFGAVQSLIAGRQQPRSSTRCRRRRPSPVRADQ